MSFSSIEAASPLLLKHYHTFMINAGDCWHPEVTPLQALSIDSHLSATGVLLCHLFISASSLHAGFHSPDGIIHYFLSSRLWFGSCFLHQQHSENEAVSMVTCRATRGRRVVGALSQVLVSIGQRRKRNGNLTRLMNIDHRGGAFNTACLLFFVQYLIREGLCTGVACIMYVSGGLKR